MKLTVIVANRNQFELTVESFVCYITSRLGPGVCAEESHRQVATGS